MSTWTLRVNPKPQTASYQLQASGSRDFSASGPEEAGDVGFEGVAS